jgi:hypothetical protein
LQLHKPQHLPITESVILLMSDKKSIVSKRGPVPQHEHSCRR